MGRYTCDMPKICLGQNGTHGDRYTTICLRYDATHCNMCAICVCTCARCCHVYVVQDEDEKEEAVEKAIEEKGDAAAIEQGGDTDAAAAAATANDKDPSSTDPAATEAAAAASLANDRSMYAPDAGGHEGRKGVVEEGQLIAEKIAADKAHMASLNLKPPPSVVAEGDPLEVLGACFELTPKSTAQDIEAKRVEIFKARIRGGRDAFHSHYMSADTDDKYETASITSVVKLRVMFLELVEMYAVRHKIVDDSYVFDEPQSRAGTPRK